MRRARNSWKGVRRGQPGGQVLSESIEAWPHLARLVRDEAFWHAAVLVRLKPGALNGRSAAGTSLESVHAVHRDLPPSTSCRLASSWIGWGTGVAIVACRG
jgi:hypothetical protein